MDFYAMKRKELQALCKKHGIRANMKNTEMAERLTLLLKEDENSITEAKPVEKQLEATEMVIDSVESQKVKKVKFSPDNETFYFVATDKDSDSDCEYKPKKWGGTRKSMGKKVLEKKEVLDVVENAREVEVVEIKDTPVSVTRSQKQKMVAGAVESVFSPGHGQKKVIIGEENVDGKGIKPVRVQKEYKAVVLHKGKEVARDDARKRTRNENTEGASQVVPSEVLLPKPPLRRSRRKTTLFSSVAGAEKELGICQAVETVKLPREPVTRKRSNAAKSGRKSSRNACKKVPAETCDDIIATAVEMDRLVQEFLEPSLLEESSVVVYKSGRKSSRNACKKVPAETCDDIIATAVEMDRLVQEFLEPSLLEESSVVVYESLDRSPVLQMGKELERDVTRKRPRNKDFGGNPEVEPGLENVLPPKARSRRSNSKTALLTESMPAENNSPLEEPKIDVGLEIQEPAGNENETDSCFNKAVEKSRKKRKGSSKKTESATKDQPVSLAASTVYSDIEKATDILAHLNGNWVVESVNFQGTSLLHKDQNDEQPIINHIESVAVEDAIFSNSTVGVMDDPCLSFNRKDTDQENTVVQNPVASPGNLRSVVVSPNACVRDVHSFTYRSECEGQTSNLLDLNEGSESEESLIVKSISRRGGVLDDQLANGVIAIVSEDQKSIDKIVMVQVDMDSKKPAEAAAEKVGEMHLGSTVPSDTTPIDSSLVKQVGNEFQPRCVGGININHIGTNFSSTCVSEVPDETSSWNEEILCNHDSTKEVMPPDNESAKALDSAQMIPIVTEEILHQAIERNSNFDESVLLDSHNTDGQVAEVKFPEISDVTEDIEEKYENESSYGERTEEVVPADNESVEELDIAQTLPTGIDEVNGGTEKSSNLDESAHPGSNNTDGQVAEDKFSNESIVNASEEIKDKCEHESSVGDRSPITLAERIMDTVESGTIPVVLKSDGDAQNSSSCGVSCSNDEYEQGNKLKAQGIHLCEEVEGLLHGSKYQNLSFDGKIVVNDHIVAPTMNSNLECAMDAVEVENERKSLKGLDIVVSVESEGVVRTSQSALPLDCMNTGDSDLHREGKASFATDERTYKDENASISDNIRTLGGGIENRMMGSKADMEDYVTYRENNNIGNCLTEGDRYCSKGDKNNQKEKENVDEDLAFQEDEENKEGACKVEEMLDAMPDLSMDKNATSKEHSQELLDIQKGVAEQDVGENSDGQVEVKHSENAIDAGDGKDILEKCDQRADESILEDNERLQEQDIVSVMLQEYVDGEKERNEYLEVKNPNVSIHEESFSEIVTDQMANEVIEFESQDKVNFGSPDNCKQISSEVEKCVSAASSDSISRDDKTAEGIAYAWKMGEDSSSKDIRGGESLSFSISSDGHRHNNDAADITGPGGMEVSKENNVDETKMVEQKLIGGSLLEARSMSDVKSFSDVSRKRLECDLGYSLHDAVVSCKDPERKNMHMLVGDNASTDGFGMLESVSGEKVDEGLDTGIYGSKDTLNSKETEEILDLHNIGTVATCSADATEPSMLKPEMGVDSPVSASNYENKALELEAASPILNGFGMKGLFKDDQTSGLKKADSTEPSMLKSEMGVDSPVSASNYENKALELEAASPILNGFGMKGLFKDDQTSGLKKADSTEPSMLKPEMGVDSPVSASNYENKALELEAASPILNGFGMKGLFKDDQTSGLKKADSTEPSMLKSEMGVDSPVSASNYENKALELEAASPILNGFGMKGLFKDDQTSGLKKADSTEPSMLKSEMGVDSPVSASNYENKALELEAASPILNGFGMKGLFKDDQTSGLKKADSTEPSMLKSEMGVDSPVSASNYENKALELEAASPILTSFGMKRLSTDDQTAGLEKSGLVMSKGNSKSEHIGDVNNLKESIDNSQVVEELHHQENKVIREVVESKSAQEMYNYCLTDSAIMDTNVHIPSFWDESTEVEPCLDNACAKPQKCNAAAIASEFNVSSSFGDLCDLKEFSKADSESAKEKVATDQPSENLRVSEDLEPRTMIGNVMVINQEEDANSLLSFGYVGANTVSPEKVVGCLENMAAGIEVSNLRLNEAPSSKDSTFDEQSKCNLGDDVLVDGNRDNNAVPDKVSTGSTEAIIGIKNVGDGIKSVEKTPQPLEGDHLLEERDSSYGKSFSDISHSRNEGGVFKKRHLSVQEGRGLKAGRVTGLKFEGVNAGIDGFADTPATASRHEIKALENVASPVANSLGMDWLFGDNDEVEKSEAEMSNTNSTSEDVKNGNGGVAIPQVGAGELGEYKHQPIEVGKLKSTQELGIHCRPCSPVTEISSHAKLDSFREKALEANLERSISVSTAPRRKNRDMFIPRTPKNLINESDMKENFNARKSEPVTNISSVKPLHGRRALEDLQNK